MAAHEYSCGALGGVRLQRNVINETSLQPLLNALQAALDFGHRVAVVWLVFDADRALPIGFDQMSNDLFARHDAVSQRARIVSARFRDVFQVQQKQVRAQRFDGFERIHALCAAPAGIQRGAAMRELAAADFRQNLIDGFSG